MYPYTTEGPPTIAPGDAWTAQNLWLDLSGVCQGICYLRSQVTLAMVHDGAGNTYMIGEKYLNPNAYFNGTDGADNESLYAGFDNDNHRSGNGWQPLCRIGRDSPIPTLSAAPTWAVSIWSSATARCMPYPMASTWRPIGA